MPGNTKPYNSKAKLLQNQKKEEQYKNAIYLYKKNSALFLALREFRKKSYKSLQLAKNNILEIDPKASVSRTNLLNWKKQFSMIIKDNTLFRDFMVAVGIDPEKVKADNQALFESVSGKKRRGTQKEKNDKLKEEMQKANLILAEISNPDITESEKWRLSERGRRHVDAVNKAVSEGGLPKVDGINELYNINGKLLATGKNIILTNLDKINVKHFGDLKALSDILDTAFKQNRLIEGKSTENVAVGVHDIYDKIIANSDKQNVNQNPDKIITQED